MKTNNVRILIANLIVLFLVACSSGGGDSGNSSKSGYQLKGTFIDSVVSGLHYEADSQAGVTDDQGVFTYEPGDTISFSIGGITLGESVGQAVLTPVHLVPGALSETNVTVTNISAFLQTLDDDGVLDNGIQITPAISNLAADKSINFNQDYYAFLADANVIAVLSELTAATSAGERTLVSAQDAQSHLSASLQNSGFSNPLVGSWALSEIEGIPESVGGPTGVNASNSTWKFRPNGTHEWFFYFNRTPYLFDVSASGAYQLMGNNLYASGLYTSAQVTFDDYFTVTFSNQNTTLSFQDDEGDHWTYNKLTSIPPIPQNFQTISNDASVTLSWDEVPAADSYSLYVAEESGITESNYDSLSGGRVITNITSPTYTLASLINGTRYYFVVTSNNGAGESLSSQQATGFPQPGLDSLLYVQSYSADLQGMYSQTCAQEPADQFILESNSTITGIRWYGSFAFGNFSNVESLNFRIRLFNDINGVPEETSFFDQLVNVNLVPSSYSGVYEFTTTQINPIDIEGNNLVWISILYDPGECPPNGTPWLWSYGVFASGDTNANGTAAYRGTYPGNIIPWTSFGVTGNLAFSLFGMN